MNLRGPIPFLFAIRTMLFLLFAIIIFHLLIIFGVIPFSIVWGGRLTTQEEMLLFESISILINSFLVFILLVKGKYLKIKLPQLFLQLVLWIFVLLFFLNTIGNLMAETSLETIIFTPITLLFSILCARIAIEKKVE